MKSKLFKLAFVTGICALTSNLAQAQNQKMGDNLGNHTATKTLQLAGQQILNASGVAIGSTALVNGSVALQISGADKAILISNVVANTDIALPLNGMIVYNSTDNKFYLFQNGAWVTFALALKASTDGIEAVSNANGYTLTQVGQETILKLAPADETNPGIVTTGIQTFAGNKIFNGNVSLATGATLNVTDGLSTLGGALNVAGNVAVGTVSAPANAIINGNADVTGITTLNGNTGTSGAPVNGLLIKNAIPALNTDAESVLVIDGVSGEVRKSSFVPNALLKQKIAVPVVTLGANEATKILLTVTGITKNDGVIVNFDADELIATAGLEYISILNATATEADQVTVTIADMRQENADGTPLVSAATLLATKSFTVTRYKQGL